MPELTPEEQIKALQKIHTYGERAKQIFAELLAACEDKDHIRGGMLVREMYDEPDLLLLVISLLTDRIIYDANKPLATPQDLGMHADDDQSEVWEVGAVDQMQAAAQEQNINTFASLAIDSLLRAYKGDIDTLEGGEVPDTETFMRAFLVMDRGTTIALAAEMLRRLTEQEVNRGA